MNMYKGMSVWVCVKGGNICVEWKKKAISIFYSFFFFAFFHFKYFQTPLQSTEFIVLWCSLICLQKLSETAFQSSRDE